MVYFLTSSSVIPGTERLNPANGFIEEMRKEFVGAKRGLFICSDPDHYEFSDRFGMSVKESFEAEGFFFSDYLILDRRNQEHAAWLVRGAEFIVLAGGHVPTQNRFFQEIGLRELLRDYDGILMGISAGTMNCADVVYAQPELEGEAVSADYQRFIPGLNITKRNVLPHYQEVKHYVLDGMRIFEDISYADSYGNEFYVLVDGSYILGREGREELRGEAYLLKDGEMKQICGLGEAVDL